jgi:hypothetical protein
MKRETVRPVVRFLAAIIPAFLFVPSALPQRVVSTKAGLIYYLEGDVFLEGKEMALIAGNYPQMQNGQLLRTKQGRAELILAPNIFLRLGENGVLRMEQNVISDAQLTLEQGFVLVEIVETIKGTRTCLRLSDGVFEASKAGLYRVDANSSEVKVYGGEALVEKGGKKARVKSKRMLHLGKSLKPSGFDTAMADSFHQWAGKRSFELFVASANPRPYDRFYVPAAPQKQAHWLVDAVGWLSNTHYGMRFFSEAHYLEWMSRREKERLSPPLFKQDPEMPSPTAPAAQPPTPLNKTM